MLFQCTPSISCFACRRGSAHNWKAGTVTCTSMITTWQKSTKLAKQQHSTVGLELQCLAHTKSNTTSEDSQGDDFASKLHALKSRMALENFKLQLELDIKVLLGADVLWVVPGKDTQSPAKLLLRLHALLLAKKAFPLPSSNPTDDGSSSSESGGEKDIEGAAIGGGDATTRGDGDSGAISGDGDAGAVSCDGGAGPLLAAKSKVPVVQATISAAQAAGCKGHSAGGDIIHATPISADDFTTWSPEKWSPQSPEQCALIILA